VVTSLMALIAPVVTVVLVVGLAAAVGVKLARRDVKKPAAPSL
jgi:hypothetical protein